MLKSIKQLNQSGKYWMSVKTSWFKAGSFIFL